jgi:hypothetical protein
MSVQLHCGDSRDVLPMLAEGSVDACVTDPPYALVSIGKRFGSDTAKPVAGDVYRRASAGFMGKRWDTGETAFDPAFWASVLRVLKPGAHLVAFGGTRSYHRLACAIEDAGFEIRDQLAWLYGSGFPKSHNVAKAIDRAAGAKGEVVPHGDPVRRIRPGSDQHKGGSWEKLADREYQPGAYVPATEAAAAWEGWGTALKPALEPIVLARKPLNGTVAANVQAHGPGALNIDACRVGEREARALNRKAGIGFGGSGAQGVVVDGGAGRWPANVIHDGSADVVEAFPREAGAFAPVRGSEPSNAVNNVYGERARIGTLHHGDAGSAARFFYAAKADSDDRLGSKHPTVKPVDLMAWLVRLITPRGGRRA